MCLTLKIVFISAWRAGTGITYNELDDTSKRDSLHGLPIFPGRQLKGILKDAVIQANSLGWLNNLTKDEQAEELFGKSGKDGILRVDNAVMLKHDAAQFKQNMRYIRKLFRQVSSNKMNHQTGITDTGALRKTETVVPLTLITTIDLVSGKHSELDWQNIIKTSLPLIRSIGANRSRGLGKVIISERHNQPQETSI